MASLWPILGAEGSSQNDETLRIFLAVVLLGVLALLFTTRPLQRIARHRAVAALVSSGWLAIMIGVLLGPHALSIVAPERLLEVRPLLLIGLGWIGAIIGTQANRALLAETPNYLWRAIAVDVVVTLLVAIGAAFVLLAPGLPEAHQRPGWLLLPLALIWAATVGWAPETRSLKDSGGPGVDRLVMFVRSASGLGAIAAVTIYGLAAAFVVRGSSGAMELSAMSGVLALLVAAVVAWLAAVGGRSLLDIANTRPESLLVFLGLVSVVAGIAAEFQHSPLFAAMLAGVMISNFAGPALRAFESYLLRAEQVVGHVFFLLAGVLLEPRFGVTGWLMVALLVATRLVLKPLAMRRAVGADGAEAPRRSGLYSAPVRQSPVAIALAVGLVLAEPSALNVRLLTVVAMVGLLTELVALLSAWVSRSRTGTAAASAASATGESSAISRNAGAP